MPTYVYHCEECDNKFEVFRKFSDPPLTQCLEGHERIRKVFVPAGIIFKGSGWYSKDSKSDSSSKSSESSDLASSSSSSSPSSSDETTKGESTSSDSTESTKSEAKASTTSKSDE